MSRNGEVTFDWGDGEHRFRLDIGQIRELQEKTDCGPFFLLKRIRNSEWRIDDLREVIRLGLIGGGLEPIKAHTLVKRYFDDRPFLEGVDPAIAILAAALVGAPDGEAPGKAKAAKATKKPRTSQTEGSPLPRSTETV